MSFKRLETEISIISYDHAHLGSYFSSLSLFSFWLKYCRCYDISLVILFYGAIVWSMGLSSLILLLPSGTRTSVLAKRKLTSFPSILILVCYFYFHHIICCRYHYIEFWFCFLIIVCFRFDSTIPKPLFTELINWSLIGIQNNCYKMLEIILVFNSFTWTNNCFSIRIGLFMCILCWKI